MLTFGSVCSGIEAASVAWEPLGWRAEWFAEVDRAACNVLAYRFPNTPNHGDMTLLAEKVLRREIPAPDVLVGGTPCQAFSVAGLRGGLQDARGQLTLAFVILADAIDRIRREDGLEPCIIVWENVPGVLNHKDNPFGCFLAGIAGEVDPLVAPGKRWTNAGVVCGPERAIAWRILDAQYFGLAQRRRRVFVVASAREGFDPGSILLEFEGVRRDSPPSRSAGQGFTHPTAPCLVSSGRGVERTGDTRGQDPVVAVLRSGHSERSVGVESVSHDRVRGSAGVAFGGNNTAGPIDVATACNAHGGPHGRLDFESETFVVHGTQDPCHSTTVAFALGRNNGGENVIAFTAKDYGGDATIESWDAQEKRIHDVRRGVTPTISARCNGGGTVDGWYINPPEMAVRRLMPVECERLQGLPDNWTLVPTGKTGKPAADGPRYKQCGNSMATRCMNWIGRRIQQHIGGMGHNGGPVFVDFDEVLG